MDVSWECSFRGNVHCESGKLRTARHPALTAMLSVARCTAAQRQAVCFGETGLGLAAVRGPAPGRRGRAPGPTALVTAARTQRLTVVNNDRRLITSSAR